MGNSGEEIPDGASPPPINGTVAPGPGGCVFHATDTLKHSHSSWMFLFRNICVLLNFMFLPNLRIPYVDMAVFIDKYTVHGHSGSCRGNVQNVAMQTACLSFPFTV